MSDLVPIPLNTRLGAPALTIARLDRSLAFYRDVLGFRLLQQEGDRAELTADGATVVLELTGIPDARPKPPRTTGLYHFAILVPTRIMLARSLRRLIDARYPLQGASDHLVSEALYLADPDGNGIEIYADRPRDQWRYQHGKIAMATEPLDLDDLLAQLSPTRGGAADEMLDPATRIGHVHLHVGDLAAAEAFYCGLLGFEVMQRDYPGALFVSAGGYHHHIGLNVWAGVGAPPPPPNAVGLRYFTIVLPTDGDLTALIERLRAAGVSPDREGPGWRLLDPAKNGVRLIADHGRRTSRPIPQEPG